MLEYWCGFFMQKLAVNIWSYICWVRFYLLSLCFYTKCFCNHLLHLLSVVDRPPAHLDPRPWRYHVTSGLKAFDLHCFSTFSSISAISSECLWSYLSSLSTDCCLCFPRCTEIVLYIKVSYLFLSSLGVLLDNKVRCTLFFVSEDIPLE